MNKGKVRALVADDEPNYLLAIQVNLEASGFEVLTVPDGQAAVEQAAAEHPDLILLDVRMPRLDGFEACRRIREFSVTPIIMLTARAAEADKVKGLDLGADDYVTKPFSAPELLARIRAVLRRAGVMEPPDQTAVFQTGDLRIEFERRRVFIGETEIRLTATEYRLLSELAHHAGKVLVPGYLLEKVWGERYDGESRLVWQIIHRLRQKLESDPHAPRYIQNRPGQGYYMALPEELTPH